MQDRPPPWLFLLLALPQGAYFGFVSTAMPWMLREAGVGVEQIATASAIINLPFVLGFVTAPLVDLGRHRRLWLIFGAASSGAAFFAATLLPLPSSLLAMTVLLTVGTVLNSFSSSAVGALMAATLDAQTRPRASGWFQVGNVGGWTIGAGAMLALLQHVSIEVAAVTGGLAIFLPSLAALALKEPVAAQGHAFRNLKTGLLDMARDKRAHQAILILLSPVGECAFSNLFTAVSDDYRASPGFVTLLTGFGGGVVTVWGALLGGLICQRMERRRALLLVGAINALTALGMMLGPLSPATYGIGTVLYSLTMGMCYTAYIALTLEIVGRDRGSGATRFALLTSAAYIPASYMIWADGQGYAAFGPGGLLGVDALTSLASAALLFAWVRYGAVRALPAAGEAVS